MEFNYYEAPTDEVFDEIKRASIELWNTFENTYDYASEKVARIKNIKNIQDNAWYMVAMFDHLNQVRLIFLLNEPAKTAVIDLLEWSKLQ